MTRQEWERALDACRADVAQRNYTRTSGSEAQQRYQAMKAVLYTVRDADMEMISSNQTAAYPPAMRRAAYDRLQQPIRWHDVIAQALHDGEPVPDAIQMEYHRYMVKWHQGAANAMASNIADETPTTPPRWFASIDNETVVEIVGATSFDDADAKAPPNTVWIYTTEALATMVIEGAHALNHALAQEKRT